MIKHSLRVFVTKKNGKGKRKNPNEILCQLNIWRKIFFYDIFQIKKEKKGRHKKFK